jgi:hypothetical protein
VQHILSRHRVVEDLVHRQEIGRASCRERVS